MMGDYMPVNDQHFDTWLRNFVAMLSVNLGMVGVAPADIAPLETASTEFTGALAEYLTQRDMMAAKSNNKKTKRTNAVALLRPMVRRIVNHPGMTDQLRGLLGLPVPAARVLNPAVGPEVPGIFVETDLGKVTIHFGTEPQNERINGKPSWARGCNVYRKRAGDAGFTLLAFDTSSPYVDEIAGDGVEYTYTVAYRGTRANEIGKQSIEATIAARGMVVAA